MKIFYLESSKDYVKIHVKDGGRSIVTLSTMKCIEERLPSDEFVRVQRSYIVSLSKISAVSKSNIWIGNIEINIGAQYKSTFKDVMDSRL